MLGPGDRDVDATDLGPGHGGVTDLADAAIELQRLALSFLASRSLTVASRVGLLTLLREPTAIDDAARELGLYRPALVRLLRLLDHHGIVVAEGRRYRVCPEYRELFDPRSEVDIAPMLDHIHRLYSSWDAELQRWLSTGEVLQDSFDMESQTEHARAQWGGSITAAEAVASWVDLGGYRHLVDLGGSAGHFSISLCNRNPDLTATLIDLEADAVAEAERRIRAHRLEGRIRTVVANYFDALSDIDDCDVALLAGTLSQETPDSAGELLELTHSALAPGGLMILVETPRSPETGGDGFSELLELHLRDFGTLRAPAELRAWMRELEIEGVREQLICNNVICIAGTTKRR